MNREFFDMGEFATTAVTTGSIGGDNEELNNNISKDFNLNETHDSDTHEETNENSKIKMIADRGGPYAYVFLVMKNAKYCAGAVVAALSIKNTNSPHDRVCMVTHDINADDRAVLLTAFTHVIEVPYINYKTSTMSQKQEEKYRSWVNSSFTKWNCLAFDQYEKVLFVDADTVIMRNMDHLFELQCPAGTFSSPWLPPYTAARRLAHSKESSHKAQLRNYYFDFRRMRELRTGDIVPKEAIRKALSGGSSVVIGTTVLLHPDVVDFDEYKLYIETAFGEEYGYKGCSSTHEEQALTDFYCRKEDSEWTFIHQLYNYIPWHRQWLKLTPAADLPPYIFHFFNGKPWETRRHEWKDLDCWWQYVEEYRGICARLGQNKEFEHFKTYIAFPEDIDVPPEKIECVWCAGDVEKHTLDDRVERIKKPNASVDDQPLFKINYAPDIAHYVTKCPKFMSAPTVAPAVFGNFEDDDDLGVQFL